VLICSLKKRGIILNLGGGGMWGRGKEGGYKGGVHFSRDSKISLKGKVRFLRRR